MEAKTQHITAIVSREVPEDVDRMFVRALVRYVGAAPVWVRAHVFTTYPLSGELPEIGSAEVLAVETPEAGALLDLGSVPVLRDSKGRARFCVSYRADPHPQLADTEFTVIGIVVDKNERPLGR